MLFILCHLAFLDHSGMASLVSVLLASDTSGIPTQSAPTPDGLPWLEQKWPGLLGYDSRAVPVGSGRGVPQLSSCMAHGCCWLANCQLSCKLAALKKLS
jgi:hypothetical protein